MPRSCTGWSRRAIPSLSTRSSARWRRQRRWSSFRHRSSASFPRCTCQRARRCWLGLRSSASGRPNLPPKDPLRQNPVNLIPRMTAVRTCWSDTVPAKATRVRGIAVGAELRSRQRPRPLPPWPIRVCLPRHRCASSRAGSGSTFPPSSARERTVPSSDLISMPPVAL